MECCTATPRHATPAAASQPADRRFGGPPQGALPTLLTEPEEGVQAAHSVRFTCPVPCYGTYVHSPERYVRWYPMTGVTNLRTLFKAVHKHHFRRHDKQAFAVMKAMGEGSSRGDCNNRAPRLQVSCSGCLCCRYVGMMVVCGRMRQHGARPILTADCLPAQKPRAAPGGQWREQTWGAISQPPRPPTRNTTPSLPTFRVPRSLQSLHVGRHLTDHSRSISHLEVPGGHRSRGDCARAPPGPRMTYLGTSGAPKTLGRGRAPDPRWLPARRSGQLGGMRCGSGVSRRSWGTWQAYWCSGGPASAPVLGGWPDG